MMSRVGRDDREKETLANAIEIGKIAGSENPPTERKSGLGTARCRSRVNLTSMVADIFSESRDVPHEV